MKICICDDEKDFIHNFQLLLKQYSKKHKNINQFNSFENENDLLSYFYSQNDIDILFLDIKFQTYSGIEIAKKIRDINPSVILIFLTSFPEYALSGYKVKAFDYLVKPLSYLQLENVLDQAISELKSNEKHFLIIKDSGNIFKIKFPEIIYIETYNRNILFHLTSGSEITGHESLKAYEDKLDERFYRCHTGYIVNMAYVTSILKDCAIFNSNVNVPVCRYKKKKFQMLFTDFLCNSIFKFQKSPERSINLSGDLILYISILMK